jgi:hypothetical protein
MGFLEVLINSKVARGTLLTFSVELACHLQCASDESFLEIIDVPSMILRDLLFLVVMVMK